MHNRLIRQIQSEIADGLVSRKLSFAGGKKGALAMLKGDFVQSLSELLPIQTRLRCDQVLELCRQTMEQCCSEAPEGGWLDFCYHYICAQMFPESFTFDCTIAQQETAVFYLTVLQTLFQHERQSVPFDPLLDFEYLTEEEYGQYDHAGEYHQFLGVWKREFVYELMRLGMEVTPYKTLSHVAGVHFIAMCAARGLKEAGVGVDLALVSAAAISHDLGKFGCRPGERVPYLHYYYTDQWLMHRKLERISRIAANHSTWDLELELLSVESLLLIYADFRSKQTYDAHNNEIIVLYPLDQAFEVILSKLDNVDDHKRRRYETVYGRLRDFEDYMKSLGIDTQAGGLRTEVLPIKDAALMAPDETVHNLTLLSVRHNLELMNMLSNENKFGNIIEAARSAKSWQQLRAYLNILEEYSTYLSIRQKTQALAFLYELLIHREGDIRRQSGGLIGRMIARFYSLYRKEVPEGKEASSLEEMPFKLWKQYIGMIVSPDHKTTPQQRSHIGYTLKNVVEDMLKNARPEDLPRFLEILLDFYEQPETISYDNAFTLLDAIRYLPPQYYDDRVRAKLIDFAAYFTKTDDVRLITAALEFLREAQNTLPPEHIRMQRIAEIAQAVNSELLTSIYLKCDILRKAGYDVGEYEQRLYEQDIISDVFLDNLKIATHWAIKVAGVELLSDQMTRGITTHTLHIATHFSNLVKVSERVVVRHIAGQALVDALPLLPRDQRNEVVVELGKGLEMGRYEISKYIPAYLGQAALYLHPSELDEQVLWLKSLLGAPNDSAAAGALNTAGVILQHYPAYRARFHEGEQRFEARRHELLGLLLQGLAHYRQPVKQEALLVIGKLLFESPVLDVEEKSHIFSLCYRKLLYLIQEAPTDSRMTFFYRASALSHINSFIAQYRQDYGPFAFEAPQKIAFFPGTFDPFTLSHKGIVRAIRAMGFEVYLAIDEFSWSKKAQPHLIRRQIVNMSVAGDFHVHLFPDDIPVNLANAEDLKRLVELFPDQQVYIVAGSDVVSNASAYRTEPKTYSIHHMNHVIFRRDGDRKTPENLPILGDVQILNLPAHLEDISSSRIRENVDMNRDISNFIDPVIQDYIYHNGLYLRDAQNKPMLSTGNLEFVWADGCDGQLMEELGENADETAKVLLLRRTDEQRQILGHVVYRMLNSSQLYDGLGDYELANRLRLKATGNVLLIESVVTGLRDKYGENRHLLMCELLAKAVEHDCVYAIYFNGNRTAEPEVEAILRRLGFVTDQSEHKVWEVDMHAPTVLMQNLETTVQEPLSQNARVKEVIRKSHERLQLALAALYPGSLVLTLSSDVIHHRLLKMITAFNNVPQVPTSPRILGENMCVPFGKLLRNRLVPNTVTKTLHTDKVYAPDLSESRIETFPNYPPIASQVRTIKSFHRPVILVDDIMHPGVRMNTIAPVMKAEGVEVRALMVGILTGYGKDRMRAWNCPVDSVYFLPRMRIWFVESTLYPFIGGNTIQRSASPVPGLLPGINHILPYAIPAFQDECGRDAAFRFSKVCLECAIDVMTVLEREYRALYGRNLTLSRLSEAVVLPLCPDKGYCLSYDPNLAASVYLKNDLEQLIRQNHSV